MVDTYRMMQLASIQSAVAAVGILLENLADQVNDVDGIDEEREAIRDLFGRSNKLYEGLREKIRKEAGVGPDLLEKDDRE